MYLTGMSVRRVEDITEAFRGTRVSPVPCPTSTEDLCQDRGLAEHRSKVCDEADLGRRGPQCLALADA